MPRANLAKTGSSETDRNFAEINRAFAEASQIINGAVTPDIDLVVGDNDIKLPAKVKNPIGRIPVYLSGAGAFYDKGLQDDGTWRVVSSTAITARFLFF